MRNVDASDPGVGPSVPRGAPRTSNPLQGSGVSSTPDPPTPAPGIKVLRHPGLGLLPLSFYLMVASVVASVPHTQVHPERSWGQHCPKSGHPRH